MEALASSTEISAVTILVENVLLPKARYEKILTILMMSTPVVCKKEACVALKAKQTQLMALVGPV